MAMKRITGILLTALLAVLVAICLAACGGDEPDNQPVENTPANNQENAGNGTGTLGDPNMGISDDTADMPVSDVSGTDEGGSLTEVENPDAQENVENADVLDEETRKQVVQYVSIPEKAIVPQDRVEAAVRDFATAYYSFDSASVTSGAYFDSVERLLGYQALDDEQRLTSIRSRLLEDAWSSHIEADSNARSRLVSVDAIDQVDTVHDGVHDHMVAVDMKAIVERNVDAEGKIEGLGTSSVSARVFLDSEFAVADFIES